MGTCLRAHHAHHVASCRILRQLREGHQFHWLDQLALLRRVGAVRVGNRIGDLLASANDGLIRLAIGGTMVLLAREVHLRGQGLS